jgi:hypothetical protein
LSCSIICCALGVACAQTEELANAAKVKSVSADKVFFMAEILMILKVDDYQ